MLKSKKRNFSFLSFYPDLRRDILYINNDRWLSSTHLLNKYFQEAQPSTALCYGDDRVGLDNSSFCCSGWRIEMLK